VKVLVTGAAGFIGSNLCDALLAQGSSVLALDDLSVGKRSNLQAAEASGQLKFVQGSILDLPLLEELVESTHYVFHLAVACLRECFERPHHVHEVNATGTLNLLDACQRKARQLERFVYVSSSEVYGSASYAPMDEKHPCLPTTTYGASKLVGELYTRAYELTHQMPTTIIRPFNTYGPREHHQGASGEVIPRFAVRIANGLAPIIFGDGSQTRDFTYVLDTAQGIIRAAEHPKTLGQTVNLARGQEVSVSRIARLLLDKMGRPDLEIQYQGARPADVQRHYADAQRLKELTGFAAQTSIEEGLDLYLDWFRQAHPEAKNLLVEVQERNW